jgi:hypothetical protein
MNLPVDYTRHDQATQFGIISWVHPSHATPTESIHHP